MIKKITLKTGTEFVPGNINILVGPNNSGKSSFLNDISNSFGGNRRNHVNTVIEKIDLSDFSVQEAREYFHKYGKEELLDTAGIMNYADGSELLFKRNNGYTYRSDEDNFIRILTGSNSFDTRIDIIEGTNTQILDGNSRLNAFSTKELRIRNFSNRGYTSNIEKLYADRELLKEFSNYTYDSLGYYAEILHGDNSTGEISLVRAPLDESKRDSLAPDVIEYLEKGKLHSSVSDGIKAFIGILIEVITGQAEIILIDELEAFLHAPLARKLGRIISKIAIDKNKQVFITTHNTNFIMGCIESHSKFHILRLTYDQDVPTSKIIKEDELKQIVTNPLLRASRVFEGLFYKNVVVVEADSDRVFYEEINYRLIEANDPRKIEDCLFINARNKQTVGDITNLLRKFGIPTVSIIDYDFIKESGSEFTAYLKKNNIPDGLHSSIQAKKKVLQAIYKEGGSEENEEKSKKIITFIEDFLKRPTLNAAGDLKRKLESQLKENNWKIELKKEGVNFLNTDSKQIAQSLINELNDYGLFPVYVGEVECWLPDVESSKHGDKWLIDKLKNMGQKISDNNYIKPNEGDVWDFMGDIQKWLNKPNRLGM